MWLWANHRMKHCIQTPVRPGLKIAGAHFLKEPFPLPMGVWRNFMLISRSWWFSQSISMSNPTDWKVPKEFLMGTG